MFRARRVLLLLPTLAFISLVGGCGGGKEPVSAAELAQKADGICREERSAFDRIQAQPPPNAKTAADQTEELIRATEKANSSLEELEPPEALRTPYELYLKARHQVIDEMRRGEDAADNQDSSAYGAAQAAVARDAPQRRKLAESLGLRVCSSSSATA